MANARAASAMAATRPAGASTFTAARKSFFEQQRELLLVDISTVQTHSSSPSLTACLRGLLANQRTFCPLKSFEQVLANINKLNRSLEAVVTVSLVFFFLALPLRFPWP